MRLVTPFGIPYPIPALNKEVVPVYIMNKFADPPHPK